MPWFSRPQPRQSAIQPLLTPRPAVPKAGTLVALVGVVGAALLLQFTPQEESGRKVDVTIADDGTAIVRHVSGKQYLDVYLDIAGIPTACDGITGRTIRPGQRFTEAQCGAMLEHELVEHTKKIKLCAPSLWKDGREYPRVASALFAFNIGAAGFCGSTARRKFEAGDIAGACNAFLPWNKARVRGVLRPVLGLTKRRNRERQICLSGLPGYPPETLTQRLRPFM